MSGLDRTKHSNWGVLAQFANASELRLAIESARRDGFSSFEAFTPFPVDELDECLQLKSTPMPWIILGGGILGGAGVYALEYWVSVFAYPLNIGGRPLNSWPAFIPPTFEGAVMGASVFAIVGVILVCGLPRLHHPLFEIEAFKRASTDGFFLAISSEGANFDSARVMGILKQAGAVECWEVPHA
ncbi:MAG: DUF3341 domain-containing protein [Aureliella sp.]